MRSGKFLQLKFVNRGVSVDARLENIDILKGVKSYITYIIYDSVFSARFFCVSILTHGFTASMVLHTPRRL